MLAYHVENIPLADVEEWRQSAVKGVRERELFENEM
jgi:hypothetical protein